MPISTHFSATLPIYQSGFLENCLRFYNEASPLYKALYFVIYYRSLLGFPRPSLLTVCRVPLVESVRCGRVGMPGDKRVGSFPYRCDLWGDTPPFGQGYINLELTLM